MNARILIVDDEEDIRKLVSGLLSDEGYVCLEAPRAEPALELIAKDAPDLVILDIWLEGSGMDGMALLKVLQRKYPQIPVLMISGHGNIETAVTAIKHGAYDFIEKPFTSERLLLMVRRALEAAQLQAENTTLRQRLDVLPALIGESEALKHLKDAIARAAPTESRVLITGPAGSGKELTARHLHAGSGRSSETLHFVSCTARDADDLALTLFGQAESSGKTAALSQAKGGSLVLDEVADMPLSVQGQLLRTLQDGAFSPLGGGAAQAFDVRLIAMTSADLPQEIAAGRFREDLFYRLSVIPIAVPPLGARRQDIMPLLAHMLGGDEAFVISPAARTALEQYDWPGNVRQLRNIAEWLQIMHQDRAAPITISDLPPEIAGAAPRLPVAANESEAELLGVMRLREAREQFERRYLETQLRRFDGNITQTAKAIGMERSALHRKLKGLGIGEGADVA